MGIRVFEDSTGEKAVLYCSTTNMAFGPVIQDYAWANAVDVAECFLAWSRPYGDLRRLPFDDLSGLYSKFLNRLETRPFTLDACFTCGNILCDTEVDGLPYHKHCVDVKE
jgi:hypothetical protein